MKSMQNKRASIG